MLLPFKGVPQTFLGIMEDIGKGFPKGLHFYTVSQFASCLQGSVSATVELFYVLVNRYCTCHKGLRLRLAYVL